MGINLYKVSKVNWAVQSDKDPEVQNFMTIEAAAEYLESLGVPSDEIDLALVDMLGNENTRAQFGALERRFIFSDKAKLNELLGVA